MESKLEASAALKFVLAGDAVFTLRSLKTGMRYTYKVRKADDSNDPGKLETWFVSYLTGPENTSDYSYIGIIREKAFRLTKASKLKADSLPVLAFVWVFGRLMQGIEPPNTEIWHAGRCGRCGRTLTVPESIASGYGPECITKIEAA